tara:strand:+ start:1200 stop:1820 length:621 start_codon:yes stop_codon:yes gene_type:complete
MLIILILASLFILWNTLLQIKTNDLENIFHPVILIFYTIIAIGWFYYSSPEYIHEKFPWVYRVVENTKCVEGYCEDGFGIEEDNHSIYEGGFKDGRYNGEGNWVNKQTHKVIWKKSGSWKNGQLHGYGTQIYFKKDGYTNPTKYVGYFSNGKKDGYGVETYYWGDRFEGNFDCCSSERPLRTGKMNYADGTSKEGEWEIVTYRTNN